MRSDRNRHVCALLPSLQQRADQYGARAESDEWHRVADEIEAALHGRHQNFFTVHRFERSENFARGVSTGDEAHHVGVHRGGDTAGKIRRAASIDVKIASTLAMNLMLELVALGIGHR